MALALVFLWPAADGRSLLVKAANFAADPRGQLPRLPPPLPMGLGDDADAVVVHDMQTQAYYDAYDASALNRARMALRDWRIGIAPTTLRQLLVALGVIGGLLVWQLADRSAGSPPSSAPPA